MPYDSRAVANAMLDQADQLGLEVTNFSLNKLLYLSHGHHFQRYDQQLVKEGFEAWEHGPVCRPVYNAFKSGKNQTIESRATRYDFTSDSHSQVSPLISQQASLSVAEVLERYGHLSVPQLYELTHLKGSPWDEVWNQGATANLGMRISDQAIRLYFHKNIQLMREYYQ